MQPIAYLQINHLSSLLLRAFDRFPYRAEWLPHSDIKARVRSRKGSVKPIVLQVGELLPRSDI